MQRHMAVRLEQEDGTMMPTRRACLYLLVNKNPNPRKLMYIVLSVQKATAFVRALFRHGFPNILNTVSPFTRGF